MALVGLEIVKILLLIIIALEGALVVYDKDEKEERVHTSRREVYGTFHNPLGDTYRKNEKHQYVPIKPNSKMLDGDDVDEI